VDFARPEESENDRSVVELWELLSGKPLGALDQAQPGGIHDLAFSPDSKTLVASMNWSQYGSGEWTFNLLPIPIAFERDIFKSGKYARFAEWWDVGKRQRTHRIEEPIARPVYVGGQHIATGRHRSLGLPVLTLLDPASGEERKIFVPRDLLGDFEDLAALPAESRYAAVMAGALPSVVPELKALADQWEAAGKKEELAALREGLESDELREYLRSFQEKFPDAKRLSLPKLPSVQLTAWVASADGKRLATAEFHDEEDSTAKLVLLSEILKQHSELDVWKLLEAERPKKVTVIRVWELESAHSVDPPEPREPPASWGEAITSQLFFDPEQTTALAAAAGRPLVTISDCPAPITTLALSPDGKWVAAGDTTGGLRVWESATGRRVLKRDAHVGPVSGLCFAPRAPVLATAGFDGVVKVWNKGQGVIIVPPEAK
jgi:hypothetical protein